MDGQDGKIIEFLLLSSVPFVIHPIYYCRNKSLRFWSFRPRSEIGYPYDAARRRPLDIHWTEHGFSFFPHDFYDNFNISLAYIQKEQTAIYDFL